MDYVKSKTGILIPQTEKPVAVHCGFCPEFIWKHKESKGRLFLHKGKPICAKCRILKGSVMRNQIRGDKKRYMRDSEEREKFLQRRANDAVREVAQASQNLNKLSQIKK